MARDELEEILEELYPHLRGTDKMHDALAARYLQAADGDDKEEVSVREAWDGHEERKIHELAESRGTTEEILGARAVVRSWNGEHIREIAKSLKVRQRVVLVYFLRFNEWGIEGLKGNGRRGDKKDKSRQTKEVVSVSEKKGPFPLKSVMFTIIPFCTVEADGPKR